MGAVFAALLLSSPLLVSAQQDSAAQQDAGDVAYAFYEAVAGHSWDAAAATLHPETLDLFAFRLSSMLERDTDGRLASLVFGPADGPTIGEQTAVSVFAQLLRAIEADTPGLIAVLATNRYDPVGSVAEGDDLTHVVLRVTPYTNGSAPTRTALVTLRRTASGWGIIESGELESLATAMTGLAITAQAPPPGPRR